MAQDNKEAVSLQTIREEDVEGRDVRRRTFLFGLGTALGTASVVGGCRDPYDRFSDPCNADVGDQIREDRDPTDPVIADNDFADPCDSD